MSEQGNLFGRTLASARIEVATLRRDGITCPCCDQYAREYKRKLNSGMVRALITLYQLGRHDPERWVNIRQQPLKLHRGEYAKLRFWGLAELDPTKREKEPGRPHHWRVTEAGRAFLLSGTVVPRYCYVFNNSAIELAPGETTDAQTALGDHFDLEELLAAR